MPAKKIYTRKKFESLRSKLAEAMASDYRLKQDALDVLVKADRYFWIHQTNWMGEPILNLASDMFTLQEIIFRTKPKFIIETGIAWGGSLLFYATLMEVLGGEKVIGVDTYIPSDLKKRLYSHRKLSKRLVLIKGSSIEEDTVSRVRSIVGACRETMIILDSHHTHEHVLRELRLYSSFVGRGFYLICGDTILDYVPRQKHRPRLWGHGNNPRTALQQFLKENNRFSPDKAIENKLLFTCNPGGYLKCLKG